MINVSYLLFINNNKELVLSMNNKISTNQSNDIKALELDATIGIESMRINSLIIDLLILVIIGLAVQVA